MSAAPDDLVPGLSGDVVDRLRTELGERAEKVLRCLRTAAAQVVQSEEDTSGLRFAESAAYNLRQALDHVVEGQDAAEGGLGAVLDAFHIYTEQKAVPGADLAAARDDLDRVLTAVEADESRASYYARRLLTYLGDRAGVGPRKRPGDLVSEYAQLRGEASAAVHNETDLAAVTTLLTRTIAWIVRAFTPPDEVVDAIRELAAQPWRDSGQIVELEELATNDHHLRLFLTEITDPAWLEPLHGASVVQVPSRETLWPGIGLLDGLGKSHPESVAALLGSLSADAAGGPKDEQIHAGFELLRVAVALGPAGHDVVAEVARLHGDVMAVRSLSVDTARAAPASDTVVLRIADAVLNHVSDLTDGDRYHATEILDHLQAGIDHDNVADRARALAGKLRRLAGSDQARYVWLGTQALTADPGEHPELLVLFAHHLARILSIAGRWGVPTPEQLAWLGRMRGEAGARLRSHVLAGADDVPIADKLTHVASRLTSTMTAEEVVLVTDVLCHEPTTDDLAVWAEALGTPSIGPGLDGDQFPWDWIRTWGWAAVLPEPVVTSWREAIDQVTESYGEPDPEELTSDPSPQWKAGYASSPYRVEHLSELPLLEAAALIAAWTPNPEDGWHAAGRLELARALAETVKADPAGWSADPGAVVAALSEPLYIEHYLRALTEHAADVAPRTQLVATALAQIPRAGTQADVETRANMEGIVLDLVRALAGNDADLSADLEDLWELALSAVRSAPEPGGGLQFPGHDALSSAISRPWGRGLQTVLALGAWEFRNQQTIRAEFETSLDAVIAMSGSVGLEFRAILASHRPLLERIAKGWLDANAAALFRDGPLARETIDLTVKWARPTTWLYRELRTELFDAALRGADNATRCVVTGALHEINGYHIDALIEHLGKNPAVLAAAAEDAVWLVQQAAPDSPQLAVAIRFWVHLLDACETADLTQALTGLGRWAMVDGIEDEQWVELTARTLTATNGRIDYPISVADRAARVPPSPTSRDILRWLLDNGKPWECHHAAGKAIDVLRASAAQSPDDSVRRLRTRLIDLGFH